MLVASVHRLDRPDLPLGEIRHIEPGRAWSTGDLVRDGAAPERPAAAAAAAASAGGPMDTDDLRAVAPIGHSFGRRGR